MSDKKQPYIAQKKPRLVKKDKFVVMYRIKHNQCIECGKPMKQIEGDENYGVFKTRCGHSKNLMFSSG